MQWLFFTAFLLFVALGYPAQAIRISALEAEQRWPQKQAKIGSRNYPIEYVLLPSARGGYRRRYVNSLGKAAPTTTTERPFIRYWNSFVRSVQPSFSFRNLTNPLANFFNDGSSNIIESSPVYLQSYDEQEQQLDEPNPVASPNSNKRKRKRRKQQKRRPAYESEENDDAYAPYDPYFVPPPPPPHAQPMFFYDTHSGSYYGVQRFSPQDFQANFYNFNAQQNEQEEVESEPEEEAPVVRRLSSRKVALLRPLPLSSIKSQVPAKLVEVSKPEKFNENEQTDDETESNAPSNAPADDEEDDADIEPNSSLSESMRNTLGTYMRDDRHTRRRQMLASDGAGAHDSDAQVSPRNQQRRVFRLDAW
ncbi:uncharacterized protein LOC108093366 [Drosophila ficusphila]|uniref:uncharacterized protein LOC108093366 n=1 Tax=Drosophila ficusphila TaxID=30025 RepID=UPI0007E60D39|nr:uncharacterized protein LOC108093366 [Drosophila ficusphila]